MRAALTVGAVRHELFFSLFTNIVVPIPRLEMQRRVVVVIEEQLAADKEGSQLKEHDKVTMGGVVQGSFGLRDEGSEL